MTNTARTALQNELSQLKADNAAATGWGAAVGARHERIKEIERELMSDKIDKLLEGRFRSRHQLLSDLSSFKAEVERLREALAPFAEPHAMGDAYVKFSPELILAARAALNKGA